MGLDGGGILEKELFLRNNAKKMPFMPCYNDFCYLCASLTKNRIYYERTD
jgi:hypothetical protein